MDSKSVNWIVYPIMTMTLMNWTESGSFDERFNLDNLDLNKQSKLKIELRTWLVQWGVTTQHR